MTIVDEVAAARLALHYLDAAWNRLDLRALAELADTQLTVFYHRSTPEATTDRHAFTAVLGDDPGWAARPPHDLRHVATQGSTAAGTG